jgi:hypothetical protein
VNPRACRAVLVPSLALAVVLAFQLAAVAAGPDPAPALHLIAMMEAQLDPAEPGSGAALRAALDGLTAVDAAASIDAAIAQLQAQLASAALGHSAMTGGPDPAATELAGQSVWELGERIAMLRALRPGSDLAASAAAAAGAASTRSFERAEGLLTLRDRDTTALRLGELVAMYVSARARGDVKLRSEAFGKWQPFVDGLSARTRPGLVAALDDAFDVTVARWRAAQATLRRSGGDERSVDRGELVLDELAIRARVLLALRDVVAADRAVPLADAIRRAITLADRDRATEPVPAERLADLITAGTSGRQARVRAEIAAMLTRGEPIDDQLGDALAHTRRGLALAAVRDGSPARELAGRAEVLEALRAGVEDETGPRAGTWMTALLRAFDAGILDAILAAIDQAPQRPGAAIAAQLTAVYPDPDARERRRRLLAGMLEARIADEEHFFASPRQVLRARHLHEVLLRMDPRAPGPDVGAAAAAVAADLGAGKRLTSVWAPVARLWWQANADEGLGLTGDAEAGIRAALEAVATDGGGHLAELLRIMDAGLAFTDAFRELERRHGRADPPDPGRDPDPTDGTPPVDQGGGQGGTPPSAPPRPGGGRTAAPAQPVPVPAPVRAPIAGASAEPPAVDAVEAPAELLAVAPAVVRALVAAPSSAVVVRAPVAAPEPQPEAVFAAPWAKQDPDPAAGIQEKVFGALPVPGLPVVIVPGQ